MIEINVQLKIKSTTICSGGDKDSSIFGRFAKHTYLARLCPIVKHNLDCMLGFSLFVRYCGIDTHIKNFALGVFLAMCPGICSLLPVFVHRV